MASKSGDSDDGGVAGDEEEAARREGRDEMLEVSQSRGIRVMFPVAPSVG